MNELTDLEICRRIAEIECVELMPHQEGDRTTFAAGSQVIYSPLTDDALCFKLMVKHEVNVNFVECPAGTGKAWYATGQYSNSNTLCTDYCSSPSKAICLAIIEANKP